MSNVVVRTPISDLPVLFLCSFRVETVILDGVSVEMCPVEMSLEAARC